jgi:hypothetical protein
VNDEIADYGDFSLRTKASVEARNHRQTGNRALLARALMLLADEAKPPLRHVAGSDAIEKAGAKLKDMGDEMTKLHELSLSTDGHFGH